MPAVTLSISTVKRLSDHGITTNSDVRPHSPYNVHGSLQLVLSEINRLVDLTQTLYLADANHHEQTVCEAQHPPPSLERFLNPSDNHQLKDVCGWMTAE